MRQFNVKAWLIALLVGLLPAASHAVGLGRLNMISALGDTLNAEIELVSVSKEELSTLSTRLSSADAYRQANLQYSAVLVGARISIERRAGGQPYIKITSNKTLNEPFIDLLVEVTSSSGRLVREYTALIDPPGAGRPPSTAAAAPVAPAARPVPAPVPPAVGPAAAPPKPMAAPAAGAKEYGPIQRGENLSKIARSVKPEGVTLEQMLVGLYRSNPDAFIRKNMNLVKAGRILRIPDKMEIEAIPQTEARSEYHAQVADWNTYRQSLAGAAGPARAEGRTTAGGRITTRVEEPAGSEAKDVVRLSRGEPPRAGAGKGSATADRVRALEEEVVAREKALTEANERITQLEKTIKDMQKLAELKSPAMAAAQQKAEQAAEKPGEKAAMQPEPKPSPKPEPKPAPQPAPKVAPPPPPAPSPSAMDAVIDTATDPVYLGTGGGVIALAGLAYWMVRRRRNRGTVADEPRKSAPVLGGAPAAPGTESTVTMPAMAAAAAAAPAPAAAGAVDDVDPLAEDEVYIAYGRDTQAEEILKDALARNPGREDAKLKLLEIYSARKDKSAFNRMAEDFNRQTGGTGDKWLAAAAMGYALDPDNALYVAGKDSAAPAGGAATSTDLDFDLGGEAAAMPTDIALDSGQVPPAHQATSVLDAEELRGMAGNQDMGAKTVASEPLAPDFNLDFPTGGAEAAPESVAQVDIATDAVPTQDGHVIDFQIELPAADQPQQQDRTQVLAEAPATDAGLDFQLDVPDLNLGAEQSAEAAPGQEKDGHWYDVQTKFDLAKAYQEMGDKDGAKEILHEVIKEGDAEQQSQAKQLLETLA